MANQCFNGVVDLCLVLAEKKDPHNRALQFYHNESGEDNSGLEFLIARKQCYQQICSMLQQLFMMAACHPQSPSVPKSPGPLIVSTDSSPFPFTPLEAQQLAEDTLQLALQSGDELFHVAIFDWLTDKKWDDKLLEVQSPYLENYLKRLTGQPEGPDLVAKYDLLWKFYEKSKNFISAARVLSRLADAHSTVISLNHRIEYLSRSIVCARAAETTSFSNAAQGQFLYELEEKMDVAKVQCMILDTVAHLPSHTKGLVDAVSRLNADLLDVTQLYEQFAEPLALWECKLAILHCAGHYDAALVVNVWLNIINDELKKLNSADTDTKIATLSNKIRALGRLYASSEQFFPLDFLIKTLESYSVKWDGNPSWVVATLLSVGVNLPRLFSSYNKLVVAKDSSGQTEGRPNHLLRVLLGLLNRFVDSPSVVPVSERRTFAGQCIDAMTFYLSELYCTAHTSSAALISEFRNVQGKFERL